MNQQGSEYRRNEDWERPQEREYEQGNSGSVAHLLRLLTSEVTTLFSKEVSLARAEMREAVREARSGIISLLSGSVVLLAGLIVLLMAAVYGLATTMELWMAAAVIGGATTVLGIIMVASGKSKLDADTLKPSRTAQAIREDRATFRHAVKGGHQ